MQKLYVIVRSDLAPGLQLAQACHALRLFAADHPEVDKAWYEGSSNLVVLQAPSEEELLALAARAGEVPTSVFREPDLGDEVTAIALGPTGAGLVSQLPLALRKSVGSERVEPASC